MSHFSGEFDDPVWWNDKVGMLAQCTQLFDAVLRETAKLCVISCLAPRTTDCNYLLHSSNNIHSVYVAMCAQVCKSLHPKKVKYYELTLLRQHELMTNNRNDH